ncbi:unnamed protein product, partial [Polarella glacialis]
APVTGRRCSSNVSVRRLRSQNCARLCFAQRRSCAVRPRTGRHSNNNKKKNKNKNNSNNNNDSSNNNSNSSNNNNNSNNHRNNKKQRQRRRSRSRRRTGRCPQERSLLLR